MGPVGLNQKISQKRACAVRLEDERYTILCRLKASEQVHSKPSHFAPISTQALPALAGARGGLGGDE